MPYKTDKIAISDPFLSRRVKLLPCQREMIHWWYAAGISITSIAKLFKVSKRLVQFELFPERKEKNLADRENRGGSMKYYDKEYNTSKVREHRQYKYKTLKDVNPK